MLEIKGTKVQREATVGISEVTMVAIFLILAVLYNLKSIHIEFGRENHRAVESKEPPKELKS